MDGLEDKYLVFWFKISHSIVYFVIKIDTSHKIIDI